MKVSFFSTRKYDQDSMQQMAKELSCKHELQFFTHRLTVQTALLAEGSDAVVIFVNDTANEAVLRKLHQLGVRALLLRCAGFDMVDLEVAKELQLPVLRVPAYSPYAVAEHAIGLVMALNRKYHRAYNRTREFNFNLQGLLGFDLHGKTVGVVGTGKIGVLFGKICLGFGCKVIAYDVFESDEAKSLGIEYVTLETLLESSDIISLHCPLFPNTRHMINDKTIAQMKPGVMIVNTSRGGLLDTEAIIRGLKSRRIGSIALDVFEGENDIFYEDHSGEILADERLTKLSTFPNVFITGHQAFFTKEALDNIAKTTFDNIDAVATGGPYENNVIKN
ncbi:hypothetical protein LEN26_020356 [Aphanomyces euteiches]|nr:hypothetical protein LEN26_020356 [Aphanomyces euteiches]KAH9129426.1 hypothetical protein AeMF1_000532 [Aphanomyces euteiches]KAH9196531.1 hypothetical protein AeNC1_001506 [Aphanomyces euteiches]